MNFIVKNYLVIIIIVAFGVFALIGYLVDNAKNKNNKEEGLLTKPNDEVDISLIREDGLNDEVDSTNVEQTIAPETEVDDLANINKE